MTRLRKKVQAAQDAYATAKYPGSLADDVLPQPATGSPWKLAFASLAAAAAMLFLGITFWPTPPRGDSVAQVERAAERRVDTIDLETQAEASEIANAESYSPESYTYVMEDVPRLPAIGSLWASDDDTDGDTGGHTAGTFTPLVPSFPSMIELAAAETETNATEGDLR
ncbi:MAG TPA: hypothetical protein PLD59_07190 [Tepidisphaeraceae bacterium]|nr:hypothetical protein [Tepidisphaeraceae bacterium]